MDLLAPHRAWLVAHPGHGTRPGRPLSFLWDVAHRSRTRGPAARSQGRARSEGHLRRDRYHHRVEQRPAHPGPRASPARPARAGLGPSGRRPHRGQRRVRRLGRAPLAARTTTDGRAQLPRAVDATGRTAPGPASARRRACRRRPGSACSGDASDHTSGSTRRPRRCSRYPTRRSCCWASGGAGRRAWRATPSRATPDGTSPCPPSIPTSCRRGSPRPMSP